MKPQANKTCRSGKAIDDVARHMFASARIKSPEKTTADRERCHGQWCIHRLILEGATIMLDCAVGED